jgi:hypothetical protein
MDWLNWLTWLTSCIAVYIGYAAHKATVVNDVHSFLTAKAQECNKYINPETLGPPDTFATISAVLTNIIYAKRLLKNTRNSHSFIFLLLDQHNFVRFFYMQLHSSNVELLKNPLVIPADATYRNILEAQHSESYKFLEKAILENPSHPKEVR